MCLMCGDLAADHSDAVAGGSSGATVGATASANVIAALNSGYSWTATGTGASVSYSFNSYDFYGDPSFAPFNAIQRAAAQTAFDRWSAVANVTFHEVGGNAGDIRFANYDLGFGIAGGAYYPGSGVGGDVFITTRYASYGAPVDGQYNFLVYLHEIGHALGLKHPGNYNGTSGTGTGTFLPAAEDDREHSVMSYYKDTATSWEPRAPQLYDIAAIQYLYGANTAYNAGNTTYMLAQGLTFNALWDGGGTDTIDLTGTSGTLYLEAGTFSQIAGVYDFVIAYGVEIENAIGGSSADTIVGNGLDNAIDGAGGNDVLDGQAGDDLLNGGQGNDTLIGGTGADVLNGGDGSDTASYDDNTVGITVNLGLSAGPEGDALRSIENLIGSHLDDVLFGNPVDNVISGGLGNNTLAGGAGNDTLIGSIGNDTLIGGTGADLLNGGDGTDTASYDDNPVGVTVNLGLSTGPDGDTLTSIEGLIGSHFDDTLFGNPSDNVILGGLGNNTLAGGAGNDTLTGSIGNDTLIGGTGADILNGGGGSDTASYDDHPVGVTVNLGLSTGPDGDVLTSIENLTGSHFADTLFGNPSNNVLEGRLGNDTLGGGAGDDTFVFQRFGGADTVTDFMPGTDHVNLHDTALHDFAAVQAASTVQNVVNTLIDLGAGDTVMLLGVAPAQLLAADFLF